MAPASRQRRLLARHGGRLFKCGAAPGGLCGRLKVPLDRSHPARGDVSLFFDYYRHTAKGKANKAIMTGEGGPGYSVTETQFEAPFYLQTFTPLMKHRDLIMFDQRGVGRSGAIDCKGLQHHNDFSSPSILRRVRKCGLQLGRRSSLYGSGDVALDMNAIRRSLGIDKLDLYGGSYAGQDVQSYASRFPGHVRSAVLDSPLSASVFGHKGSPLDDFGTDIAHAGPRIAATLCARSGNCSASDIKARSAISWLAKRLRLHPVSGTAADADGAQHHVRVTEGTLGWNLLGNGDSSHTAQSEIVGAARALRSGDDVPLLRLAVENRGGGDSGPAKIFSDGDSLARACTDVSLPWNKRAPIKTRFKQYRKAKAALPANQFGPFSVDGWLTRPPAAFAPDPCIEWPKPSRHTRRAVPRNAKFPAKVPALILTGDIDSNVPEADSKALQRLWPNSDYVNIKGAGHHTIFQGGPCSGTIIVHFIAAKKPGDTKCARKFPEKNSYPVVSNFPLEASDAVEASSDGGGDQSTATDRKIATVTAATVTDSFRRAFQQSQTGVGPGLRGGSFDAAFGDGFITANLSGDEWTNDVTVNGSVDYDFPTEKIGNDNLTVDGPGPEDGTLSVSGAWFGFGVRTNVLHVSGTLGGRNISVDVPAS